jgi:Queuosine biosynthesis protein QueC
MTAIHCGPLPAVAGASVILDPSPPNRQVVLNVTGVEKSAAMTLLPLVRDLLTVAAYVFLADGAVPRARKRDPLAKNWRRELALHVPVHEPDRWNAVRDELTAVLEFATDDSWTFEFRRGQADEQLKLDLVTAGGDDPTCVSLFSGGLDSLAGALRLVDDGERPILASHWTTNTGRSFKDGVLEVLRTTKAGWRFPNPTLQTVRGPGAGDAQDYTQRSRGVLYLGLGVAVAMQAGLDRLIVPENGVTSLNLAQSAQSVGAMRSRTTHPKTLWLYRQLLAALGIAVTVDTPFADSTKADVIREAITRGGEALAHRTVSCARGMFRRPIQPHCGTCSQCVDRRFAGIAAGWDDDIERPQHEVDLFRDPLKDGEPAMYAEQYLRFAWTALDMTPDDLAREQDVWRAAQVADNANAEITRIYALVQRHAEQIDGAYQAVFTRNHPDYVRGKLPAKGLLRRIGELEHRREPWERLADRIAEVVAPAVRKGFAKRQPSNEDELQRQIDVAQTAAKMNLDREFPTVSFGQVGTRPDFSGSTQGDASDEPDLFVEAKLVRTKSDVRKVTDEILADIPKYADRGRSALFLVYDLGGFITDDSDFAGRFEERGPVRVRVLRR